MRHAKPEIETRVLRAYRKAYDESPYYRRMLTKIGLTRESPRTLEEYQSNVPLMTRSDLIKQAQVAPVSAGGGGETSRKKQVRVQAEGRDEGPLFLSLRASDLRFLASRTASIWSEMGVGKGDGVLIYDYGSSISTLSSSKSFVSYLNRGATELLKCVVSSNDGLPDYAPRAVHILRYLRPKLLVIRKDCLALLSSCLRSQNAGLREYGVTCVAVTSNEDYIGAREREAYLRELGTRVSSILRVDDALFLSSSCEESGLLHANSADYYIEVIDPETGESLSLGSPGRLVVTNLFARGTHSIRYATSLTCRLTEPRCKHASSQHFLPEGFS